MVAAATVLAVGPSVALKRRFPVGSAFSLALPVMAVFLVGRLQRLDQVRDRRAGADRGRNQAREAVAGGRHAGLRPVRRPAFVGRTGSAVVVTRVYLLHAPQPGSVAVLQPTRKHAE